MKRKQILILIVCLALVVCGLVACLLFGGKQGRTAQSQLIQEDVPALADDQKSSADAAASPEKDSQTKQNTSGQMINSENTSSVAEHAAELELPEMEIPIEQGDINRNDEKDGSQESGTPETSGADISSNESESTGKPESEPESTAQPSDTDKPTEDSSSSEKQQDETPENNKPDPTQASPSETSDSTPTQSEANHEQESGSSDIIIQENGDILLPEVP